MSERLRHAANALLAKMEEQADTGEAIAELIHALNDAPPLQPRPSRPEPTLRQLAEILIEAIAELRELTGELRVYNHFHTRRR